MDSPYWGPLTLRPRQNGRHFPDDIFRCIFLNENVWISINISLKFVLNGPINNIPALVQVMAWRRPGGKPLSEPVMVSLLTHICVTRPQWVNAKSVSIPWCDHGIACIHIQSARLTKYIKPIANYFILLPINHIFLPIWIFCATIYSTVKQKR